MLFPFMHVMEVGVAADGSGLGTMELNVWSILSPADVDECLPIHSNEPSQGSRCVVGHVMSHDLLS